MLSVSATDDRIRVTMDGDTKTVRFDGTKQAGDIGCRRTTRQVCIRWAVLTGSSEELASYAWRRCENGRMPSPNAISEAQWAELLESMDIEIGWIVNDPSSKYYIHG